MHPDLATEQDYLDRAHDHLAVMQSTATRLADRFQLTARTDFNDAAVEHTMRRYRAALDVGGSLCFGRIDEDDGERWYIGRRHVEDAGGDAVVVDWRAGVATPFYRATFADPLGLPGGAASPWRAASSSSCSTRTSPTPTAPTAPRASPTRSWPSSTGAAPARCATSWPPSRPSRTS